MFHEQFEHQNVAHSMENERFSLKNAANTVDMAASSSKMLQIARKMNRTGNKKNTQNPIMRCCHHEARSRKQNHSIVHQPFQGYFTTFDGILLLMYGFGPIPYSSVFLGSVWFFIGCHARIRCEEREGYPTFLLKWQFRTQCIEIGGTWKFLKDVQSTNGPKASRKERLVREKAR